METTTNGNVLDKRPESAGQAERTRSGRYFRPNVDIIEKPDELTLFADIPGASAESIEVSFENGVLTLHAAVADRQTDLTRYVWREYGVGDFYRTFQVTEEVDSTRITAEYHDGVLVLHLPKAEAAKPRRISVQTA